MPDHELATGVDEIRRLLETRLDSTDFKVEIDKVAGKDDRVLSLLRWVARGRASGAEATLKFATVTTIREGRVAEIDFYLDRAAPRRASAIDT